MTLLELSRQRGLGSLGTSETPDVKTLPWDKPSEKELKAEARMSKIQDWAMIVGLVGGAVGLILSIKQFRKKA